MLTTCETVNLINDCAYSALLLICLHEIVLTGLVSQHDAKSFVMLGVKWFAAAALSAETALKRFGEVRKVPNWVFPSLQCNPLQLS